MNRMLHEIINLKARREVLRAECGYTTDATRHLSKAQLHQIDEDTKHNIDPTIVLEFIDENIKRDEQMLKLSH